MPIDFTTAGGQVRLLIADVNEADFALDDNMIAGFLARYGVEATAPSGSYKRGPVNRAAADAIDAIAVSEALVLKVLGTVDGLKTDGAKLADALRARAWSLRDQAAKDDASNDGEQTAYFGVAEFRPGCDRLEAEERPTWAW